MPKRLKITIGPNRDEMQIAHVNDSSNPTVIDSELFVGRVLIKIRDFEGITPDGSNPIRDHVYFDGRSRKFDIQIEGKFKRRPGVPLYSGEEVHFGSDFDHLVDFPKSAFNAGMRVARWIDPNTFYELSPPNGRPFIMSPYLACMNTLCAWPSPDRLSDALVCLRQSDRDDDNQTDGKAQDMVPMEEVDQNDIGKKKIGRHPRRYWRFIGLRNDGSRIDAFIEKNRTLLAKPHPQPSAQQIHTDQQSLNQNQIMNQANLLPSEDVPGRVASHSNGVSPGDQVQSISIGQKDNESGDDDDALSIRAPSSHATFSTAIEGNFDCSRPLPSSSSSYHFSPRIFPRHQVSLGAGMRDLYQDAEIEANEREGEARAQRIMDTVGEDEPMINPHPSSSPMHPSGSNQSLDSNDPLKKANKKVKHRLKKLKDAFHKLTPSSMHSSPNRSGSVSPSYKHYSTALHGKTPKELGPNQGTVSRASSRTLPNRNLTQLLRGESRSAETVTSVSRRASLMPRPQSHYSSSNRNLDGLDPRLLNQFRSTSLDHSRQPIPLTPPSPTSPDRSVPLSTTKDSRQNTQTLTVRVPSDLSRAAKSDHAESLLVSSSPSTYRSGTTSETSTSIGIADMAQVNAQTQNLTQEQLINSPISDKEQQHLSINGTDPGQATKRSSRSSLRPSDGEDARSGTGSSVTSGSTPRAAPTSQLSSSSTIKEVGAMDGEVQNYSPAEVLPTLSVSQENGQDVLGDVSQSTDEQELDSQMAEKNQKRKVVTQAEIDQAPELKDVEVGDLMFANMLNLSGDSGKNGKDFVEKQLGPWRFGDPTTDILEDNTFVFLNKSVDVQKRRKFFSEGNGKHRKSFTYDPDVVYATSFFSPFMDFNTFDLAIGPVKMNVSRVLGDMPIRYTLRSTRIEKRRRLKKVREEKIVEEHMNVNSDGGAGSEDGGAKSGGRTKGDETSGISEDNGNESKLNNHVDYDDEKEEEEEIREEEIFVTIAFELVD